MENTQNLDLFAVQTIKNNKACTGDHQLSSAFDATFPAQVRIALKQVEAGKNAFNQRVRVLR